MLFRSNKIMDLKSELKGNELWPEILWPASFFIDTESNRVITMRNMFLITEYDECLLSLIEHLKKIDGIKKIDVRKNIEKQENDMYFISCHIDESLYPGVSNFLIDCDSEIHTHEWIVNDIRDTINNTNRIRESNRIIDDTLHFNEEIHIQQ